MHERSGRWRLGLAVSLLLLVVKGEPSSAQLRSRLGPAAAQLQLVWDAYKGQLDDTKLAGTPLSASVGPALDYAFSTSPAQLRRGTLNAGVKARLRRVVEELRLGRPLVVSVIGTSVSWGTGASKRGTTDWVYMIPAALQLAFPQANITVHNGCQPGTGSAFANMCLENMIHPDTQLLLMEFATNDFIQRPEFFGNPITLAFERLIRKALRLPRHPAVVLLPFLAWTQGYNTTSTVKAPYHYTAEDMHNVVAQYYNIPVLSMRGAWWHEAESGFSGLPDPVQPQTAPHGWIDLLGEDLVHPNDFGHRAILDLLMWLVLQTKIDLAHHPLARADARIIRKPLSPPLHPGNYDEPQQLCLLEEALERAVDMKATHGWTMVNEGTAVKKKFGLVATQPGAELHLQINTSMVMGRRITPELAAISSNTTRRLGVMLGYLQSYSAMGIVSIRCEGGCVCPSKDQDSYHSQKTSTTFMSLVSAVVTDEHCGIILKVLDRTSSTGHKFKVSALMMSRLDQMGFSWSPEKAAEWRVHESLAVNS